MTFELILKVSGEDGTVSQVSLGDICLGEVHDVALFGLKLSESKQVLTRLQREKVRLPRCCQYRTARVPPALGLGGVGVCAKRVGGQLVVPA